MTLDQIKQISIREYLGAKGIKPTKENEYRGIYHSPLRIDNNASFSVNYIQNVFFDHGIGTGGSIIDLVSRLESCSIGEAIKRLETDCFSFHRKEIVSNKNEGKLTQAIKIINLTTLTNPILLNYLKSRYIDTQIAKLFCSEIHYSVNEKTYFAIGYKNDSGGYELRNKYFKGCTSKDITSIMTGQNNCLLFEGFMDYLSYLTIKRLIDPIKSDIIILNSISLVKHVIEKIPVYQQISCFLDNDNAGFQAIGILQKKYGHIILNKSIHYGEYNDLNDFLCGKKMKQKVNPVFHK
jgi:DNA primase